MLAPHFISLSLSFFFSILKYDDDSLHRYFPYVSFFPIHRLPAEKKNKANELSNQCENTGFFTAIFYLPTDTNFDSH